MNSGNSEPQINTDATPQSHIFDGGVGRTSLRFNKLTSQQAYLRRIAKDWLVSQQPPVVLIGTVSLSEIGVQVEHCDASKCSIAKKRQVSGVNRLNVRQSTWKEFFLQILQTLPNQLQTNPNSEVINPNSEVVNDVE